MASAAPAFATSIPTRKDPGINGWVQVNYGTGNRFSATFDSDPAGVDPSTPDGAPFGLYIYDTLPEDLFSAGSITLWFRGAVSSWTYGPRSNATNGGGHGRGWSAPISVGTQRKPDGLDYRGYRFDYTGPFVLSGGLNWLKDFEATANRVNSSDATFWVERRIAINGQMNTLQRRNGARGSMGEGFPAGLQATRRMTPGEGANSSVL